MCTDLQNQINEIQEAIGPQADYLPLDARLKNLGDVEIRDFLANLKQEEKEKFFDALRRFKYYTQLIQDVMEERLGSNFQLLILIALVEFVMGKESYVPLPNFLEEKLKTVSVCDKDAVQSWLDEWRKQYGSVNNIRRFFEEYLKSYEKELLEYVRQCEGWEECKTIPRFVNQLTRYRNDFVHSLSTSQIWPSDKKLGTDWKLTTVLSVPFVTKIVWIGVLTKFGYKGQF